MYYPSKDEYKMNKNAFCLKGGNNKRRQKNITSN